MALILKNKEIEEFYNKARRAYDQIDFPKWKRIGLKKLSLGNLDPYNKSLFEGRDNPYLFEAHQLNEFGALLQDHHRALKDMISIDKPYGVHPKFTTLAEGYANSGFLFYAPKGYVSDPIVVNFTIDLDHPVVVDHNLIVADEDSTVTILVVYQDDIVMEEAHDGEHYDYYHIGLTKIIAHPSAKVHIIKVQNFSDLVLHVDNTISVIEKDAKVTYNVLDFGADVLATDYTVYLDGDGSISHNETAYLGHGKRKLDIGFNMFHQGRYSESFIETKGALLDQSKKVFRGNLKFEKGSKRSKGSESEYVLLLDPRVHSDAIPALLCDEDDVSGEHAASAGQISDNQLFYLMSRGFSKKEAIKLIVHGNFSDVIDQIPVEAIKTMVEETLIERLVGI